MIVIESFNDKYFKLNGIRYARIYQPLQSGSIGIAINSIYDTRVVLVNSTNFNEFEIDGSTYLTQAETIAAILVVVWSREGASAEIFRPSVEPVLVGSDLIIDFAGSAQAIIEPRKSGGARAIDVDFNLKFSDFANLEITSIRLMLTGSRAIQMTNGSGGQPNIKASDIGSAGSWDSGSKILTVNATTSDIVELSYERDRQAVLFDLKMGGVLG
jgi:hypothetical protein